MRLVLGSTGSNNKACLRKRVESGAIFALAALLAAALLCVGWQPAFAQVSTGSISGSFADVQGGAIVGVTVRAVLVATNQEFTTISDRAGSFRLNALPIGIYRIEATKDGFKSVSVSGVEVAIAVDRGLGTIKLDLGEQTVSIEVSSGVPLVEQSEAQVTNTFSGAVFSSFSGVQENQGLDNIALFVPGVVSSRDVGFSNTNGGVGFSSNGLRGRNNDQEIDGQNNNDNSIGGASLALGDTEFVQQYDVITNNFGAEYGRNAGSVVNVATKSGTNEWHGSVYGNENNSVLNSLTSTAITSGTKKPPRANEEFSGATVGGPIVRDKMFIFGGFDTDIVSTSTVYNSSNLTPTPAGLATLAGCFASGPSSAAVSALTRFGPFGQTIGNPVATPTGPNNTFLNQTFGGCPGVQVGGVTRTVSNPNHAYNWVTRWDYQLGSSDTLSARYLFQKTTNINSNFDNPVAGYFVNIPALSQNILVSETHTFSTGMVNDFRVGFGRENVQFGGSTNGTAPTDGNILNGLTNVTFLTATQGFGVGFAFPQGRVVDTWQVQDNWNYVAGKNQFKAGVNFTHQLSPNTFLPAINGVFVFNSLNDYVSGQPQQLVIAQGSPKIDFKENDTFLYFADDLKLRQNLTLNLGLTWSYFSQPDNLLHQIDTQNETGPNPLFNPALPLSVRTTPVLPVYNKAFGPSVGFAYTPHWGSRWFGNGKTVIRGGYRLAYDPPFYNIYLNNYDGTPNILQASLLPTAANPLLIPASLTGAAARALAAPSLPVGQLDPRNFGETVIPQNFRPDQVQSWSFGVQRQLSQTLAFEVRYTGNHASDLFQSVNANPFVGTAADPGLAQVFPNLLPAGVTPCTTAGAPGFGRLNCNEGAVLSRENSASSSYNALQTELRANNLFKQLTLRAAYTFSKTLDNSSEIFSSAPNGAGSTTDLAQNPFNIAGGERGLSGLDIPHQFSLVATEELPFFKGQSGWLGHLAGGWGLSGTYIWASGQPYTAIEPTFANRTELCDCFDNGFLGDFNNGQGVARPFVGSLSAPANTVGIFAGDACTSLGVGCAAPANQLISLNAANNGNVQNVTNNQVRFIANTGIAQTAFGTPFGNVARNSLRDAPSNTANFSVFRNVKFNERASLQFRATAENVFNHANFATVVPDLENAGLTGFNTGFAAPALTGDSIPGSLIAASRRLFFGLTLRY
jgi:hypothetical protein